jgi:hypothetical protein
MEKIEKYIFNYWDVITMIPFFLCAFIVKNELLSYGLIFMGIVGFIHHIFINTYRFLILDIISISIFGIIFTIISKIPQYIKDILYYLEISVFIFLLFCFTTNIKYSNRALLIIVSIIWLPLVIFSIKFISHASGFIGLITLFLYMSSVTLCGENHKFIRISWPFIHITFAVCIFLIFYELDLLRSEIYSPIKHILDYIVEKS